MQSQVHIQPGLTIQGKLPRLEPSHLPGRYMVRPLMDVDGFRNPKGPQPPFECIPNRINNGISSTNLVNPGFLKHQQYECSKHQVYTIRRRRGCFFFAFSSNVFQGLQRMTSSICWWLCHFFMLSGVNMFRF